MMKNIKSISILLIAFMILSACSVEENTAQSLEENDSIIESNKSEIPLNTLNTLKTVKPYNDIRYFDWLEKNNKEIYEVNEYNQEDICTFTFNQGTILKGHEDLQRKIMENGKNPGLGIRLIHEQGITGKNINVAIIDQNLLLNHPEFCGKITAYYDTGCNLDHDRGSMHAPAVTSLLVGDSIGVAPDAKVYYAAAPSWNGDSEYYAKGLYWIIEENKKLPDGEKIRVVSVSAAPSGEETLFTKNLHMWDEAVFAAQEEGILVLDCRINSETGIIAPAFYDPDDPDNVHKCIGGFPTSVYKVPSSEIGVPTSYRTVAEEYFEGSPSYQYTGQGGLSWGIPYAAGVLALGWQVNPSLNNDQILQLLFDTCTIANDGSNIINPPAFIEAVKGIYK